MLKPERRGPFRSRPDQNPRVIYKRYKAPDGAIQEFTKEEFENVVEVFRMLLEADRKLKRQFESLSHQACDEDKNPEILEPMQEP